MSMRARVHPTLGFLGNLVRTHPFTSSYVLVLIVIAAATPALAQRHHGYRLGVGTGYEPFIEQHQWWTPLTSFVFTNTAAELVLVLAVAAVVVGVAESLMGWRRTFIAFVVTGVAGTVAGIGLQALGSHGNELWSHRVIELASLDPLTAIAGTIMTASGFASVLWRRRIRVLTLLISLVFLLYSGQPSDLYRLLAVLIGLLLGMVMRSQRHVLAWTRSSHHEIRVLMASVVAISAIGPVIALLAPTRFGPLAPVAMLISDSVPDAGGVLNMCRVTDVTSSCLRDLTLERIDSPGAVLVSIVPLIALLLASYGLVRSRRFAVWLAVAVNLFLTVLGAVAFGLFPAPGSRPGLAHTPARYWEVALALIVSMLLPLLIAIALVVLRRHFTLLASRRRIRQYVLTVIIAGAGLAAVYVGAGWAVRDSAFTRAVNLGDLLADVAERFVPLGFVRHAPVDFLPNTPLGFALYHGVGAVFWAIVVLAAIRPLLDTPAREHGSDAAHIRTLLETGGGDALSFMATWPGNSYWFDAAGDTAVAYRVVGRVALTVGSPFGSAASTEKSIGRFAQFCDDNDWIPVFYSVPSELKPVFDSMGWESMIVAEETVIRPREWSTTGKRWQDVRSSINRAQRAGVRAVWSSYSALSLTQSAQLAEMSEQWVAEKELPEMGFTLGGLDELRDPAVRLMLAVDEAGLVEGVTSWLPSYRDGVVIGWTLDFMRRRPDGINGVMEFLIASAAERMRDDGIEFMSLSAAPLAHTGGVTSDAASFTDRILGYLSTSLEPVYGFRSLLSFKRKFQPEFHPLLMAYPDAVALPTIGLALARAYLPTVSIAEAATLVRGRA